MAFHRRKLLDLALYCKPYCDKEPEFNGFCPPECLAVCPSTCTEQNNQSPPPPPPPPPPPASTTNLIKSTPLSLLLIASLSVLATAFLIFTCYTIYKFYAVWRRSRRRRPPQPRRPEDDDDGDSLDGEEDYGPAVDHPIWYIRTVGLQPSVINAIAIVKYKKSDGLVDGTDCAVCLSEFQEDDTVRLLPKCSHAFHLPCIDTWLASHTNCPMCRAGIVSNAAAPSPPADDEARPEASAEARIEIEDDENIGFKMDEVQPVRRSVSMDSMSASVISAAVANALSESNKQLEKGKESDVGRRSVPSMQIGGSSSIKRSASCSAKVFLSRHCSRNGR